MERLFRTAVVARLRLAEINGCRVRLFRRQDGQSLIEYVTLIAFGLMVVAAIYFLFTVVQSKFQSAGQQIQGIPESWLPLERA